MKPRRVSVVNINQKLVDLPRIQTPSFFSMPKVYADAETNLTPSNAEISIGDANSENSPC